jgi:predicted DNA-binding transcriptional regulator AlpA
MQVSASSLVTLLLLALLDRVPVSAIRCKQTRVIVGMSLAYAAKQLGDEATIRRAFVEKVQSAIGRSAAKAFIAELDTAWPEWMATATQPFLDQMISLVEPPAIRRPMRACDLARSLGVSEWTIHQRILSGELPPRTLGFGNRKLLWPYSTIEAYLNRTASPAPIRLNTELPIVDMTFSSESVEAFIASRKTGAN